MIKSHASMLWKLTGRHGEEDEGPSSSIGWSSEDEATGGGDVMHREAVLEKLE